MANTIFSDRLAQALEQRDMRQSDLIRIAAQQGIKLGKSQVSQYVSGKTMPRADVVRDIASVLGVDQEWLAGQEGRAADPSASTAQAPAASPPAGASANGATSVAVASAAAAPESGAPAPGPATAEQASISEAAAGDAVPPATPTQPTQQQPTRSTPMREFKKSSKLDNVLYDVRGPVVDEASRMEAEGLRILKLNIGNPAPFGFRTPDEVVQDMRHQLPDCEGYSDSKGLFSRAQGHHAVRAAQAHPQRGHGQHLHRQRRVRAHQPVHAGAARHGRRDLDPQPGLPAVDRVRHALRRHARGTTSATRKRSGTRTSRTSSPRSPRAPRPSSSSTPTTPRAPCTRARCWRVSSRSRASTSS